LTDKAGQAKKTNKTWENEQEWIELKQAYLYLKNHYKTHISLRIASEP
jgi:hypothetical protein